MKIKRYIAMLTTIVVLFSMICVDASNGAVQSAGSLLSVSIDNQDGRVINAFYEGEIPTFGLTVHNKGSLATDARISSVVSDDTGAVVDTFSRDLTLGNGQKMIIGYTPQIDNKFGVYTVDVTLASSTELATKTIKFSYTRTAEKFLEKLGYACHFSRGKLEGGNDETVKMGQQLIAESGAGWIRDSISWSEVETVKGKYTVPQHIDDYVNMAIANGQKVILLIVGGNSLYETGKGPNGEAIPCLPVTTEGINGFAKFAAFVAEYFKGRVDTFEIWNEPDWIGFSGHYDWLPNQTTSGWLTLATKSSDAYFNLIKAVYPAIKNVYSGQPEKVTVISGGSMAITSSTGYMGKLLSKSGISSYMDGVAFHPYSDVARPADVYSRYETSDFSSQIELLKGMTTKPIYITEYGASDFGNSSNGGNDGVSSFKGYGIWGNDGQAMALVRAYMVAAFDPDIKLLTIHRFKEHSTVEDVETGYGVIDYDYMPKRGYAALANMSAVLADAEPTKTISAVTSNYSSSDCIRHYEFDDKKNGNKIFVVSARDTSSSSGTTVKIEEGSGAVATATLNNTNKCLTVTGSYKGAVKVIDMLGNELSSEDGVYPVGMAPVYIVCSKSGIEVSGDMVNVSGNATKANSLVTIVAYKKNSINQEIAYINQAKSDASGNYTFTFEKSTGDIYDIRVYNGSSYLNESCDTELYDIDLKLYKNGVEVKKIGELQLGDVIKLEMKITDTNSKNNNLVACGCIYGEDAVMLDIDRSVSVWSGNSTVLTTELTVTENTDIEDLKFMLWDMNMRPVFNAIQAE